MKRYILLVMLFCGLNNVKVLAQHQNLNGLVNYKMPPSAQTKPKNQAIVVRSPNALIQSSIMNDIRNYKTTSSIKQYSSNEELVLYVPKIKTYENVLSPLNSAMNYKTNQLAFFNRKNEVGLQAVDSVAVNNQKVQP
jgi:hypothetical protein